jgi:hypothetical protein
MKLETKLEIFSKISSFENLPILTFNPSKVSLSFNVFSLLHQLLRFTILLLPRKIVGTYFQILKSEIIFEK